MFGHWTELYRHVFVLGLVTGLLVMLLSCIVLQIKGNIFTITYKFLGVLAGPTAALFLFAVFFSKVQTQVDIFFCHVTHVKHI